MKFARSGLDLPGQGRSLGLDGTNSFADFFQTARGILLQPEPILGAREFITDR